MRLKLKILSYLSSTSAEEKDLGNLETSYEISDAPNEGSTRTYRVSTGVSNQTLDLAGLADGSYVLIKTNKEVTLRINGTASVKITPPTGFSYGYLLLTTAGVTALDVSNASGGTATITVQLAGDVT